jgi:cytochrome o ubiquinol oxidase subunit 2
MSFKAQAVIEQEFDSWAGIVQRSHQSLSFDEYAKLARPSENNQVALYSEPAVNLYDTVLMQYMGHSRMMPPQNYASMKVEYAHSH